MGMSDRDDLRKLINDLAVVRGRVVLSSGAEADWYVDLRRLALYHGDIEQAEQPQIGIADRDQRLHVGQHPDVARRHGLIGFARRPPDLRRRSGIECGLDDRAPAC